MWQKYEGKKEKKFSALEPSLELLALPQHEWCIMAIQQCSDSLPILESWRVKAPQSFLSSLSLIIQWGGKCCSLEPLGKR